MTPFAHGPAEEQLRGLRLALERGTGVEITGELGRGARAVVFRVRREGTEYALKTLLGTVGSGDATAFRREGALLASVQHPGLVRIHDVGEVDGHPYLVMDLVEGEPLNQVLGSGPMAVDLLLQLGADVAGGLSATHRTGLVHRDVKPHNIVIRRGGSAVLVDFGLIDRIRDQADGEDAATVMGTLAYASPEQSGMLCRPVDGRSDLYSLGIVLYECAAGKRPFPVTDLGEMLRLNATEPVPDLAASRPDLPAGLIAVIEKLLAKDPDDRYQSGEGVRHDLALVAGGDTLAGGPGRDDHPAQTDHPLVGRSAQAATLSSWWSRVRAGQGASVVVHGPAGSGKSRLVRELLSEVAATGGAVLRGKAVPDPAAPLMALRAAIEQYAADLRARDPKSQDRIVDGLRRAAGSAAGLLGAFSPALARLLGVERPVAADRHEQFATAMAVFLATLARVEGGAVLFLDDVQWLDEVTRRVLDQVSAELPHTPLLVVGAARDGGEDHTGPAPFRTAMSGTVVEDLTLGEIEGAAVARLVSNELAGARLPAEVTEQLVRRSGGNPFGVREYLRAVLDAGLLRPSWGDWLLDVDGLDDLALSSDSLGLMAQRVKALPKGLVPPLRLAATIGTHFSGRLLARVHGMQEQSVGAWLDQAGRHGLIEHRAGDDYVFLHDRIREAVLAGIDGEELTDLHQRIAEVLATDPAARDSTTDPAGTAVATDVDRGLVYAIAQHGLLGRTDRAPEWLIGRCLAAGRQALADHAPAEALAFLRPLPELAARTGAQVGPGGYEQLGIALHRTGRIAEAVAAFESALESTTDRLDRAHLYSLIADAHLWTWNIPATLAATEHALQELRHRLPSNPLVLTGSVLACAARAPFSSLARRLRGRPPERRRRELRLLARLYVLAGDVMWLCYRPDVQWLFTMLALPAVNRVGVCEEYVRVQRSLGACSRLAIRRSGARREKRARECAAEIGDPGLIAEVAGYAAFAAVAAGGSFTDDQYLSCLAEHRRWLELGLHVNLIAALVCEELVKGHPRLALDWHRQGQDTLGDDYCESHPFSFLGIPVAAQTGKVEEAQRRLEVARHAPGVDHPGGEQNLLCLTETIALTELGDHGPDFGRATASFTSLVPKPKLIIPSNRVFYVFQAYGRAAAYRTATSAHREEARAAAEAAIAQLGELANRPVLCAHHHALRAELELLGGDPESALVEAAQGEDLALRHDVPLALYEVARVRSRALTVIGQPEQAKLQAWIALHLALHHGWTLRAQWARAEFGLDGDDGSGFGSYSWPSRSVSQGDLAGGMTLLQERRRLQVLERVGLAASRLLDPGELMQVVLEETIKVLAAERAFLFLLDEDSGALTCRAARGVDGRLPDAPTAYAASLVSQVAATGEAVVVTGTDSGAARGSESAVIHGLRSVLVGPLRLAGHTVGVIYLDSRIAKGIFTSADSGLLTVIGNQIAVSLQTARASRLAVEKAIAVQQRDTAELLRTSMRTISESLDSDEVLTRMAEEFDQLPALPSTDVWLIRRDGQVLHPTACSRETGPTRTQPTQTESPGSGAGEVRSSSTDPSCATWRESVDATDDVCALDLAEPVTGEGVNRLPRPLRRILDAQLRGVTSWLLVPLDAAGRRVGVLLLVDVAAEAYSETHTRLAGALASQGMTAYEKAELFAQTQRFAVTDPLTGIANRRAFFEQAHRALVSAQHRSHPLAILMIDIDRFKKINDTYGHQTGDEVIQEVVARILTRLRVDDILGRYGGEEFALVAPHLPPDAAEGLAERLRQAVAEEPFETTHGPLPVTVSVGVVSHTPGPVDTSPLRDLVDRADQALYEAKRTGKNRVSQWEASCGDQAGARGPSADARVISFGES